MVLCTLLSAPVMFVTAKMLLLPMTCKTVAALSNNLGRTAADLSYVSLACIVWVLVSFFIFRVGLF